MFKCKGVDSDKKTKNPCRICCKNVTEKTGIRCKGACRKWAHFKCLNFDKQKIKDIKSGLIKIICPCPSCSSKHLRQNFCGKDACPGSERPFVRACPQPCPKYAQRGCSPIPCTEPIPPQPCGYPVPAWNPPCPTRPFVRRTHSPCQSGDQTVRPYIPCRCTANLRSNRPPTRCVPTCKFEKRPLLIKKQKKDKRCFHSPSSCSLESLRQLLLSAPYCPLDIPQCAPQCSGQQPERCHRPRPFPIPPFCPPCPKRAPPCPDRSPQCPVRSPERSCYQNNRFISEPPSCMIEPSWRRNIRNQACSVKQKTSPLEIAACLSNRSFSQPETCNYSPCVAKCRCAKSCATQISLSSRSCSSCSSTSASSCCSSQVLNRATCIRKTNSCFDNKALQIPSPIWYPSMKMWFPADVRFRKFESCYEFSQNMPSLPIVPTNTDKLLTTLDLPSRSVGFLNGKQDTMSTVKPLMLKYGAYSGVIAPVATIRSASHYVISQENVSEAEAKKSKSDSHLSSYRPHRLLKAAILQMCETMDQIKDVMMRMVSVFDE